MFFYTKCLFRPRSGMVKILLVMKLIIILLTTAILQVSAAGYAQKVTLIQNNARLSTVLDEIRKQTGYDFVYSDKVMNNAKRVSLNLKNAELDEALEICFKDQPLSFKVEDKMVIIRPKEKSYLEGLVDRFLAMDVRGKVVDSLGIGIAGATVSVKNGKGSTSTSANGDFYLKNVEEGSVLVISYLGYVTKEQAASKDFNYVILKQSTSQLDEVLVQAYGTTTRRLSTGNIAMITSKEISQQNINNPLLALQGRVAGVEISQLNGLPGGPVDIKVRGQYSLSSKNEPLIVIDGVPFINNITGLGSIAGGSFSVPSPVSAFSYINPNDIESISVLKDGDATSIYGSRGSNGVILVTTKKAKRGQTSFDFVLNSGIQELAKKLNLLNTEQYLQMRKEALDNGGLSTRLQNPSRYASTYPDLLVWDQKRYTDWQEVFIGKAARYSDVQGTISGGTELIQYRLGGTYHKETYVFPGEAFDKKANGNITLTGVSPNQKFRTRLTVGYMFGENLTPGSDLTKDAMTLSPNAPSLYSEFGELNWEPNPYLETGDFTFPNPLAYLGNPFTQKINNLTTSGDISYEIAPKIFLKTAFGYSKLDGSSVIVSSSAASLPPSFPINEFSRIATYMNTGAQNWSIEPQMTYNINFGQGNLDVLLGGSLQNQSRSSDRLTAYGFSSDAVMKSKGQATGYMEIGNSSSEYKYNAFFARLKYNLKDRYLVSLSGRRDGSSRFGPSRQFGNFWSLGSAWIFSKSKLLQSLSPIFSFGKIRFSYGTSGNDGIGDYGFMELYGPNTSVVKYRGLVPLSSSGLSNPYYSWETVRKMEFGLDLSFVDDRFNFTGNYFRNRSSDLLGGYSAPKIAGPTTNFTVNRPALIQTMGWEFLLTTRNISKANFSWNTSINMDFMRNKMLASFDGDRTQPGLGEPFYGYTEVAMFSGVDPVSGQYQFVGIDGLPTFFSSPEFAVTTKIRTQPIFSAGITNSFAYKNLSLDVFVQGAKQNGENYMFLFSNGPGTSSNQPADVMSSRWRSAGDNSKFQRFYGGGTNPIPEVTSREAYSAIRNSSLGWTDASFVRLKTVSLSYDLSNFAKQKLHLRNLRIFTQGQNLATWTKFKGTDPEIRDPFVLPALRSMTFGLQITL